MPSPFGLVKNWFSRNAKHAVVHFLPRDGAPAVKPNDSYVRLWLADMFLKQDRAKFTDYYPMVHATLELSYADKRVEFTSVARAPEGQLGPGERRNYPLTPLLPWRGGVIELEVGLSILPGKNLLAPVLDVLGSLSKLIAPPLGSALAVADQVGAAVNGLLDANSEPIVLGLHDSFAAAGGGARTLQAGHLLVAGCSPAALPSAGLAISDGSLHVARDGRTEPLTGVDYMLIEVSALAERDDWRFPALEQAINQALDAIIVHGNRDEFARYRDAALSMIITSTDLTPTDRQRVAVAVRDELVAAEGGGQRAFGEAFPDLRTIVATRAPTAADARDLPPLSLGSLVSPV